MTYQKGAWVLHMLREKMGHEAFKNGIQAYYNKYFNKNTTTDDFFEEMQKFAKSPLSNFRNQWLHRPEVLNLQASWTYDAISSQLEIKIIQNQPSGFYFDIPVEIEIIEHGGKGKKIIKLDVNTKDATFKIPLDKKPAALLPDPRTVLLAKFDIREG
jgi:aminopeptidase N